MQQQVCFSFFQVARVFILCFCVFLLMQSVGSEVIGLHLKVYWPLDDAYYLGLVTEFDPTLNRHKVFLLVFTDFQPFLCLFGLFSRCLRWNILMEMLNGFVCIERFFIGPQSQVHLFDLPRPLQLKEKGIRTSKYESGSREKIKMTMKTVLQFQLLLPAFLYPLPALLYPLHHLKLPFLAPIAARR